MTPREAAKALREICSYMGSGRPDKGRVRDDLRRVRDAVLGTRSAAQVGKFTKAEYDAASNGLQGLVDKILKAAKTMNPQDPGRADLEREAASLMNIKGAMAESYNNVSRMNV